MTDKPAKRHHFVPETYLRAWCDSRGRVAVRRRASTSTFLADPSNVAVESHLYGSGAAADWRERQFNLVEDEWPRLRRELVLRGHVFGRDRALVCLYIALQISRTREHLAQVSFGPELMDFTTSRPPSREDVRRFIEERHGHTPNAAEVEAAWSLACYEIMQDEPTSFDAAFSAAMHSAITNLAPILDSLCWRVEICDVPVLWTSDRPVMPWRPPSERDSYEGVGYGNCDEIRMPLSAVAMLVMQRRASPSPVSVGARTFYQYNDDIALQCYEFLVSMPARRTRLDRVSLAPSRPAVRFNLGPGVRVGRHGERQQMGDIVHTWIPLRADGVT